MSITYVGRHHVVLMQPPDGRVDTVRRLRYVQTVTNASFGASGTLSIDLPPIRRRAGRLMSITYVGRYHVVLMQPPDGRVGTVRRVRYVRTVTNASFRASGTLLFAISRP